MKKCSLFDDSEECKGNCETCTDYGKDYDKDQMYKYEELSEYGTAGITVICCPACKRKRTYHMEYYFKHAAECSTQGNCKECKWKKE